MKNIFTAKISKTDTLAHKALWLTGFVVMYMLCYTGLELLWNKLVTGSDFTFNVEQLPGETLSAILIGALTMYFMFSSEKSKKEKA